MRAPTTSNPIWSRPAIWCWLRGTKTSFPTPPMSPPARNSRIAAGARRSTGNWFRAGSPRISRWPNCVRCGPSSGCPRCAPAIRVTIRSTRSPPSPRSSGWCAPRRPRRVAGSGYIPSSSIPTSCCNPPASTPSTCWCWRCARRAMPAPMRRCSCRASRSPRSSGSPSGPISG